VNPIRGISNCRVGLPDLHAAAEGTFLLAPSLSRILPELKSRGLLTRRQDANAHRSGLIGLAPAGFKLIEAHAPVSEATHEDIGARFGQERLDQLLSLLRELEVVMSDGDSTQLEQAPVARRAKSARSQHHPWGAQLLHRRERTGRAHRTGI
jgi:DNA-binding MarR family transcriptional regulator